MLKSQKNQYTGMSKDMSRDKQSNKYFDAKNIRVVATDQKSTFSLTNEAGNELVLSIPKPSVQEFSSSIQYTVVLPNGNSAQDLVFSTSGTEPSHLVASYGSNRSSGDQVIIGVKELRDSAIIITTDSLGFDCFWELTGLTVDDIQLNLLYLGELGLSKDNLVQILYNYENSIIQKIYFADGVNQLRFFNIRQSIQNGDSINLIDLNPSSIDVVSEFELSQPKIKVESGGSHTSGMIQYAYNLYVLNGSQTTISPLSELIPIAKDNGLGGGKVNEVLGKAVLVNIPNVDKRFTHIKVYSVKYTSYNENPEITIVADKEVNKNSSNGFSFIDNGNQGTSISIDAFIFLGSNPIIPKHITTKDNRLFPINITEKIFDVDLDCRAFSFFSNGTSKISHGIYYDNSLPYLSDNEKQRDYGSKTGSSVNDLFNEGEEFDSINPDYKIYKFQAGGSYNSPDPAFGGSGKYVDVEIVQNETLSENDAASFKFFKDEELYRIGIKFYNRIGQESLPKWIMDFRTPPGNLEGKYNQLRVTLTADFYTWLNDSSNFANEDEKPVGYKILRADRTIADQTIHSQGLINPMVANIPGRRFYLAPINPDMKNVINNEGDQAGTTDIIPSVIRLFKPQMPFSKCTDYLTLRADAHKDVSQLNNQIGILDFTAPYNEVGKLVNSKYTRASNHQYNRLMQFFSPEVLFRDISIDSSYQLRVKGLAEQSKVSNWSKEVNPVSTDVVLDIMFKNSIGRYKANLDSSGNFLNTVSSIDSNDYNVNKGKLSWAHDYGFFGQTSDNKNKDNVHHEDQMYREFLGNFNLPGANEDGRTFDVYGSPELTPEGADFTSYNNDPRIRYCNHLKSMLLHANRQGEILGQNTHGSKCITFMLGSNDTSIDLKHRWSIEKVHTDVRLGSHTNGVMICEFVKNIQTLHTGDYYGGMTYEAKKSSTYIDIGNYNDINTNGVLINSPGDTFVGTFTFTKMAKTPVENKSVEFNTFSEIVRIKVETTVDLKNRNDLSVKDWDLRFQPLHEEYLQYNNVYSQQPNLIKSVGLGSKFKKIQEFDGRIMSSKEKIPGEFVDNWTDFLENETMDLDGKYGPINAVVNLNDEIFCLQDTGLSQIAINPRAQVQAQDGISIELGTGGILHDYKYISTTTGCLNKWGVISSESAFYFVDVINKSINTFNSKGLSKLSDVKGFHHDFLNKINHNEIKNDNSVSGTGLSLGYSSLNSDVYFSFHQSENPFTIRFSEKTGEFMSYVSYVPSWYISKGDVLITTNSDNDEVWEHFKGKPNHFYGDHFPSSITFHSAPQGNEIIMNNASYAMELTDLNGAEVLNKGLTGVRVYNDYQDSGMVDLELRKNIWKKFRNWKLNFPRHKGTRDRVRSMWAFTEFEFNNLEGNKLILHDITLFYTQH